MENKTFISTFEKLRYEGQVEDLCSWFDNITGDKGSFNKLASILSKMLELNMKLNETKLFKSITINKIRSITTDALEIVNKFNNNTIYK